MVKRGAVCLLKPFQGFRNYSMGQNGLIIVMMLLYGYSSNFPYYKVD